VHINIIILVAMVLAALWTVMSRSLLRAAIGLAITSVALTIIMFRLSSPLAAVFELSVCTGLISVLFISAISLSAPAAREEILGRMKEQLARFWFLPVLVVILGVILMLAKVGPILKLPAEESLKDARMVLWNLRRIDVIGQIIVLLTGVFGVIVLFKERPGK
jgi:NADH-quinone oxidoreductase subunit J